MHPCKGKLQLWLCKYNVSDVRRCFKQGGWQCIAFVPCKYFCKPCQLFALLGRISPHHAAHKGANPGSTQLSLKPQASEQAMTRKKVLAMAQKGMVRHPILPVADPGEFQRFLLKHPQVKASALAFLSFFTFTYWYRTLVTIAINTGFVFAMHTNHTHFSQVDQVYLVIHTVAII